MLGIPPAIRPAIVLSHWGLTASWLSAGFPLYADWGPCHRPRHDIVVPSPIEIDLINSPYVGTNHFLADSPPKRETLLFFSGTLEYVNNPVVYEDGQPLYSHGVRQRVARLFADTPGFAIRSPPWKGNADHNADMATSVFCLAPTGLGFGVRFVHAIFHGCIPVVISDNVTQAFDEDLPFDKFAIRVPERDIPQLDDILRAVSPEQVSAMQRELACVYKAYSWTSVYGATGRESGHQDAFTVTMLALKNRRDFKGGVPPSATRSWAPAMKQQQKVIQRGDGKPISNMACPAAGEAARGGRPSEDCCRRPMGQPEFQPWPPGGALHT